MPSLGLDEPPVHGCAEPPQGGDGGGNATARNGEPARPAPDGGGKPRRACRDGCSSGACWSPARRSSCSAAAAFAYRLHVDRHPGPERGLPDRRRRSSTTPTARRDRPVRQPEPHQRPAVRRAPARPGRGHRRRGPHLLHQQGHRPQGHPAGGVQQRARRLHPGRVDDHPAVRQGPLPLPGAHPHPQGEGGVPLAEDPAPAVQGRDPAGLPQHHLLRPRRLRHPGRGAGLLRQGRQGPDGPGGRCARRRS